VSVEGHLRRVITVDKVARPRGGLNTQLDEAMNLVKSGRIALIQDCSTDIQDVETEIRYRAKIVEPVALPRPKTMGPITYVEQTGPITFSTNWHHDQSFAASPPTWSALLCVASGEFVVPTVFCDGAALLAYLSPGMRRMLENESAYHQAYYPTDDVASADRLEVVAEAIHPVVIEVEGQVAGLFINPSNVDCFVNWSSANSAPILDYLYAMMNWPELTVVHYWRPGDLLLWPNRRYVHRALPLSSGASPRKLIRMTGIWSD
jgi:alpha-ketoglutarate-dependent taurine dioxygenase